MDWILSHIPLVIALVTFIGGWVSQQRKKSAEAKQLDQGTKRTTGTVPPPLKPVDVADDPVRRIQEELRRTILERSRPATREASRSPLPSRPVTAAAKPRPAPLVPRPVVVPLNVPRPKPLVTSPASRDWEVENARRNEEQRREARKVDQAAVQSANAAQAAGTDGNNLWTSELRNPANLRKALILREVLGPPVSMRR